MKSKIWLILLILSIVLENCKSDQIKNRVESIIDSLHKTYAPDGRVALFDVQVVIGEDGQLKVKGETNLPAAQKALVDTLNASKIPFVDSLIVLPEAGLKNNIWALVSLSVVPLRKAPAYSSEMLSQTLMGTPVKVLKKEDNWYLIQTPDYYLGWVQEAGLSFRTPETIKEWRHNSSRYVVTALEAVVYSKASVKSIPQSDLVLGNIVEVDETSGDLWGIKLPDGREGFVNKTVIERLTKWENQNPDIEKVVSTAWSLFGRPYLWGGTSTKGVDCSGFVKTAYFSNGLILARDASQQVNFGQKVDLSDFDHLQKGDLLFFGKQKGRITHVGLYIGNGYYLHSSGRVQENSLLKNDSLFNSDRLKQLQAARRIISAIDSQQIVELKNHSWYN